MGSVAKPLMTGISASVLCLVTGCATPTGGDVPIGAEPPPLSLYTPTEIIVGTQNAGTFTVVGSCVLFERARPKASRSPTLFPQGSTWVDGGSAIRLPNGQTIPIERTIEVAYEAPPSARGSVPECPGEPIQILNVVDKEN